MMADQASSLDTLNSQETLLELKHTPEGLQDHKQLLSSQDSQ